ncbi:MAG: hypothetical protein OEZ22_09205 [Spirochaetia bacterium]|nr:hypothetical protein [Spirochaetia bacterium]
MKLRLLSIKFTSVFLPVFFLCFIAFLNCGSGLCDGTEGAASVGIGAECLTNENCQREEAACYDSEIPINLICLTNFSGGYCGAKGCKTNADCPESSICVIHDDGINYCFLICTEKPQCNTYRTSENEANCSASIDYADKSTSKTTKACVPPSSGL